MRVWSHSIGLIAPPTASGLTRQNRAARSHHVSTFWLLKNNADGGTEYVCFRGDDESVEMLEGYHLPPQMPLIKRRSWMNRVDALSCRSRLERSEGFRHGAPLF